MSQQPSGWYDDPSNPDMLRYWDGVLWTNHTAPKKSPTASQSTIGLPQQPPASQGPSQPTAPLPQGGGWHGQHTPQQYQQHPGQYPQHPQYPQYPQYPQSPSAGWMAPGPSTADGVPLASWGKRVIARILDNLVTSFVTLVLGWSWASELMSWYVDVVQKAAETGVAPDPVQVSEQVMRYLLPLTILGLAVSVVYETVFLMRSGATLGKLALGISVRRTGAAGPLDLASALKRQVIQIAAQAGGSIQAVSSILGILSLLDYLWPLWDAKRQALHDKIADTQVVVGRQPGPQR